MKKFDLGAFAKSLNVSDSDTTGMQVELIDIDRIDANDANFYELSSLQGLADSIAMDGLQQPLVVMPQAEGDHVTLLSGHRRRAAIKMLIEDTEAPREDLRAVPCVVKRYKSAAMAELQLILANSTARVLTSAETMRQAERMEALLYQLKEEGYDFPGRMRDQVAAACRVSASKLARLKVIRDKLRQPFLRQFEEDKLSEQAAYALARLPEDVQEMAAGVLKEKIAVGGCAENLLENWERLTAQRECSYGLIGDKCSNAEGRIKATICRQYSWQDCPGGCCMTCCNAESCPGVCGHKRAAKKDEKAKAAKDKAKAEKKEAQRREELRRQSQQNAQRLLRAIDAAGLTDEEKFRFEDYDYYPAVSVSELRDAAEGRFGDKTLYSVQYAPASRKRIIEFSQRLGCSADYLLGLTDELRPCRRAWSAGLPEHDCEVVGKFSLDGAVIRSLAFYDAQQQAFRFSRTGEQIEAGCVAWVELPEDGA